jgi:hypothetical protein
VLTARIVIAVDLSAIIFVVLALAWAVYLIPKALKHHDEMASDRLVEGHSDKVRILSRKAKAAVADAVEAITPDEPATAAETSEPTPAPVARTRPRPTRAAARKAAQRRRRVLGVLVLGLVVVWTFTWFAYLPMWAPGVPGAMVVAWLVVARLSVRNQQRGRRSRPVVAEARSVAPVVEHAATTGRTDDLIDRLADEDTTGLARQQIEAVLADDGSLWDPLPMTLPTYVNKARARRTVRTIELTGINSSGHDETDSALAREAAESAQSAEESEAQRRVAGA